MTRSRRVVEANEPQTTKTVTKEVLSWLRADSIGLSVGSDPRGLVVAVVLPSAGGCPEEMGFLLFSGLR